MGGIKLRTVTRIPPNPWRQTDDSDEADQRLADVESCSLDKLAGQLYEERSRNGMCDFPIMHRVKGFWHKADTEIHLVAFNKTTETIRFGSCKRSLGKLISDMNNFKQQVARFIQTIPKYRGWTQQLAGISAVEALLLYFLFSTLYFGSVITLRRRASSRSGPHS